MNKNILIINKNNASASEIRYCLTGPETNVFCAENMNDALSYMRGRRIQRRNQSDIYRRVGNNGEIEKRLRGMTARVQISNTKARKYLFYGWGTVHSCIFSLLFGVNCGKHNKKQSHSSQ